MLNIISFINLQRFSVILLMQNAQMVFETCTLLQNVEISDIISKKHISNYCTIKIQINYYLLSKD